MNLSKLSTLHCVTIDYCSLHVSPYHICPSIRVSTLTVLPPLKHKYNTFENFGHVNHAIHRNSTSFIEIEKRQREVSKTVKKDHKGTPIQWANGESCYMIVNFSLVSKIQLFPPIKFQLRQFYVSPFLCVFLHG